LAKIEQKKVDPGYGLVSRLFDALERAKKDECWQYMSTDVMTARKGESVVEVASKMKEKGYSQVPVFDGDIPIGMLTERRIIELKKPYQTLRVEQAMEDHAIVSKETSYDTVASMMKEFQAVLVQEGGRIVGIITATDLIGHNPKRVKREEHPNEVRT